MCVLGAMMDWIELSVEMTGYEADQAKIFNRSVKELILTRSKFQSANSGTSTHPYERTNGNWYREKYKAKNFRTW